MFDDIKVGDAHILHHLTDGMTDHRLHGRVVKVTKVFATFGELHVLGFGRAAHPTEIKIRKKSGLAEKATRDEGYRLLAE